jgi:cbb3-type cytochrome oxidase subunit 1
MIEDKAAALGNKLIRAHVGAAFIGLVLSTLFGLMTSIKFHIPEFLSGHGWDTWGRLRYNHTQGILYAWLGNAFIAFLYYAVPPLTRQSFASARLGWWIFALWNVGAVLGGWTLTLAGISQPLEWAEFPLVIAAVIELCLVLLIVQFGAPFWKCGPSELYVAGWYLLGGITFTALAYPVGNILPRLLPGAMGAAFSGLWIHDAVGIFVTPFATAMPTRDTCRDEKTDLQPLLLDDWFLAALSGLSIERNSPLHILLAAHECAARLRSSLYLSGYRRHHRRHQLVVVYRTRNRRQCSAGYPLRFIWTSVVLYLVVSIQGSVQAVMSFNRFTHFTDWVIGHSHLAMIGFASFAAMGALSHIWQRLPGVRPF